MPVENIFANGTLMFNKKKENQTLPESVYSHFGEIHEDSEFTDADLKLIKEKDDSVKTHWRYLTDAKAKAKKQDRDELEALAAGEPLPDDNETKTAVVDDKKA